MDKEIIQLYDDQYKEGGGCWNRQTCLTRGKIETFSGPGSMVINTENLISKFPEIFKKLNIKTMVDIPCGDFNFMQYIIKDDIDYIGIDISKNAIQRCKKYENSNIKFFQGDIIKNDIPPNKDLILCKDLTLHLSFEDIKTLLNNIVKSKCKYFACSRYNNGNIKNKDTYDNRSGLAARPIEITKAPFYFNYEEIEEVNYTLNGLVDKLIFFKINN